MAALKEKYSYDIVGEESNKIYTRFYYQDIKNDIQSCLSKLSNDDLISCVMFNLSFENESDLCCFFADLCIKQDIDVIPTDENIKIVFNQMMYKKEELQSIYSLPLVFKNDLSQLFDVESDLELNINDFRKPLFGLLKLSYIANVKTDSLGMLSLDELKEKNLLKLYQLYNDLSMLEQTNRYNEAKSLVEAIYRDLNIVELPESNLNEINNLYSALDDRVNRIYTNKPTQEQIDIVKNVKKYLLSLKRSNIINFNKLSKASYSGYGVYSEDLYREIDTIVMNGPCYNDGFDRELYKTLSKKDKIKYAYNFFLILNRRGELDTSNFNHRYLIKLLSMINSIKETNEKENKDSFQRER